MFIDTHCHFDFPPFCGDEQRSLQLAAQVGVDKIVVPAISRANLQRVSELAHSYPAIYAALGLHPLYIDQHQEAHLADLEHFLKQKHEKLVAVGEIGLDLYMAESQFEKQKALLCAQLRLAKQYELPVILHSRKSHDQMAAILRRINLPRTGVVHGFAGSLSQAETFIRLGYYIGVGGTITYERAQKTRRVMAELPLTSLVLETDARICHFSAFRENLTGRKELPEFLLCYVSFVANLLMKLLTNFIITVLNYLDWLYD